MPHLRNLYMLLFAFSLAAAARAEESSQALSQLLDEAWEFEMRESPVWATHVGDHRFNHLLSRERLADQERRVKQRRAFLERLKKIDPEKLASEDRLNHEIF